MKTSIRTGCPRRSLAAWVAARGAIVPTALALVGLSSSALFVLVVQVVSRSAVQPGLGATLQAVGLLVPAAVELALPVAVTTGVAVSGARLAERGALLGLATAGWPARRLLPPVLLAAAVLAGVQAAVGHQLAPRGRAAARDVLAGDLAELRLRPGVPVVVGRDELLLRIGDHAEEGAWADVFVASGAVVAAAERGAMGAAGVLELRRGEVVGLDATPPWRVRFEEARVPLIATDPRVELVERSTPRLRQLVARMRENAREAAYEELHLHKRTTAALAVPLLAALGLVLGARSRAPGAIVVITTTAWWASLRVFDKLVDGVGAGVSAAAPLTLLLLAAVASWWTWRDR